ncbi:hypothetical protein O9992_14570 [Vibrio lentus]|nr:hypothetical protein [Vibrio lentus]
MFLERTSVIMGALSFPTTFKRPVSTDVPLGGRALQAKLAIDHCYLPMKPRKTSILSKIAAAHNASKLVADALGFR